MKRANSFIIIFIIYLLASVVALEGKIYLLIGALLNTLLFLFVSIPLADGKQSKKEGFEDYKKQTFALLPIKKRA